MSNSPGSAGASPPVAPEQLRELLHRAAVAAARHRAAVARLLEIDDTEASALAHLAQHGRLTPGELGRLVGLTSGGTTALIQRLELAGHVTRERHPRDKRSSILTPSPAVVARASELYAPLIAELNALVAELSEAERAAVARYLAKVAEASERHARSVRELGRAEQQDVVTAPAPGLWA
jgi:DNA-binding MarR family transcriptional regulator